LLYVFIIIEKNKYFYLFLFLRPVIMLKATSHAKTKIKTPPGSLLTGMCFYFWIYTATAVHEAGALAPANAHGAAPWSLLTKVYLSFWIYTATAAYSQALQCLRMGMA
jgi:hypothetical protein